MKRIKYLVLAAALLCSSGLFTSCFFYTEDNPVNPAEQAAIDNRNVLISHIENDARLLADNISSESFNATSQAFAQLLALIENDRNFISNMRTLFSLASVKKSMFNTYPVEMGSELAEMGYLLYIIADYGGFEAQVIFDGKGNSRINSADHLEFIFPATVDGFGTTLFKLIVSNSEDCYQSVTDIPNMKRIAYVARLPKSITMTLSGFIDNQEQTLSQSVINLELPQKENSEYVSFDAGSFRLYGSQNAYLNDSGESALDYSLAMTDNQMTFDYAYSNNGMKVVSCNTQMNLSQKEDFISQMTNDAFNVADLKSLSVRLLDDLSITGFISDGTAFANAFSTVIQSRQQTSSSDKLTEAVETINQTCHLQISCNQMTKPETLKFCVVQNDDYYLIEPALKDLKSSDLIPVSQFVDDQTMKVFDQLFKHSFTPAGNASGSVLKFYSVLMQMMPISR